MNLKHLKPKCGNCSAGKPMQGHARNVWCQARPPMVFLSIAASPVIKGLPGGGMQKNYESAFPPMDREEGWCREWEPDEATEKLIRNEAQREAARIIDDRQAAQFDPPTFRA